MSRKLGTHQWNALFILNIFQALFQLKDMYVNIIFMDHDAGLLREHNPMHQVLF